MSKTVEDELSQRRKLLASRTGRGRGDERIEVAVASAYLLHLLDFHLFGLAGLSGREVRLEIHLEGRHEYGDVA